MDAPLAACLLATCLGVGAVVSGLSEAWAKESYNRSLRDPDLYHLVDQLGNPVGQKVQKP